MNRQELMEKRDKMRKRLDYLWTDQAMNDEVFVRYIPKMVIALVPCLMVMAVLTYLLHEFGGYDLMSGLKVAVCFTIIMYLMIGLLLRENAYSSAFNNIVRRRKKMMRRIERVEAAIRKCDHELEFISLEPTPPTKTPA